MPGRYAAALRRVHASWSTRSQRRTTPPRSARESGTPHAYGGRPRVEVLKRPRSSPPACLASTPSSSEAALSGGSRFATARRGRAPLSRRSGGHLGRDRRPVRGDVESEGRGGLALACGIVLAVHATEGRRKRLAGHCIERRWHTLEEPIACVTLPGHEYSALSLSRSDLVSRVETLSTVSELFSSDSSCAPLFHI